MIVETSEYKLKYLAIFLTTTLQVISLNSLNNTSIETITGSMPLVISTWFVKR